MGFRRAAGHGGIVSSRRAFSYLSEMNLPYSLKHLVLKTISSNRTLYGISLILQIRKFSIRWAIGVLSRQVGATERELNFPLPEPRHSTTVFNG